METTKVINNLTFQIDKLEDIETTHTAIQEFLKSKPIVQLDQIWKYKANSKENLIQNDEYVVVSISNFVYIKDLKGNIQHINARFFYDHFDYTDKKTLSKDKLQKLPDFRTIFPTLDIKQQDYQFKVLDIQKLYDNPDTNVKNCIIPTNNSVFKTITDSIASMIEYKNSNYGDAIANPLQIFAGKAKCGSRLDEKLSRVKHSETLRKNDVVDTIGLLIHVCKENNWTNFDEFKD